MSKLLAAALVVWLAAVTLAILSFFDVVYVPSGERAERSEQELLGERHALRDCPLFRR